MPIVCVGPCCAMNQPLEISSHTVRVASDGRKSARPGMAVLPVHNRSRLRGHRARLAPSCLPRFPSDRACASRRSFTAVVTCSIFTLPPFTARSGLRTRTGTPAPSGSGRSGFFALPHRYRAFTGQNFITTTASSATSPPSLPLACALSTGPLSRSTGAALPRLTAPAPMARLRGPSSKHVIQLTSIGLCRYFAPLTPVCRRINRRFAATPSGFPYGFLFSEPPTVGQLNGPCHSDCLSPFGRG